MKEIKNTLEKQLELLSERSQSPSCEVQEMVEMSLAMAEIAKTIMYPLWRQEVAKVSRQCSKG